MLNFNNFIVREDFIEQYMNIGGIMLYAGAIIIIIYVCWSFKW